MFRFQGLGLRVQGLGFKVYVFGFRVQGWGFRVQGFEFRARGAGFKVLGSGLWGSQLCKATSYPHFLLDYLPSFERASFLGLRFRGLGLRI